MPTLIDSLPPPPTLQPPVFGNSSVFTAPWADWLWRLQQKVNTAPIGSGTQVAIQFQYGGSNLGTSGTVSTINFTGNTLTVSRVSDTLTIDSKQLALPELMAFICAQG